MTTSVDSDHWSDCSFRLPWVYRNFPKFSDRQVWANSADPDQTARSALFAIPSASFGWITLRKRHLDKLLGWLQQIFGVFEYLGILRYTVCPKT